MTARFDLDAPPEAAESWFAAARREGCDECLLVIYDDAITARAFLPDEGLSVWEGFASRHGMRVTDALAVSGDRWWSYYCANERCCPQGGNHLVEAGAVAAAAVSFGMVAAANRAEVAGELAADAVRVRAVTRVMDAMEASDGLLVGRLMGSSGSGSLRAQRPQSLAHLEALLTAHAERPGPCTAADAAKALFSLCDIVVRDAMIAVVPVQRDTHVMAFWRDLTQCAPPGFVAPPAVLYALCAWASGDGTRANVGIVRALEDRPDYRMAHLLDAGVSGGLNPRELIPDLVQVADKERTKLLRRGRRAPRR